MGFEHATPGVLLLALILVLPVLYYIGVARRTKNLYVRRIPGVDAVDEAVGRSAERAAHAGRPLCARGRVVVRSPARGRVSKREDRRSGRRPRAIGGGRPEFGLTGRRGGG